MWLPRYFSNLLSRLVLLISLFWRVDGSPIPIRSFDLTTSIDPSYDAWSETLSGVGPLILLIGERATKQLLRNVRGTADAFSLAAAPLGLLSVVTSLIRLCGIQRLRAFIGYELEARAVAAIEMTRVNCGGVHAEIVDGYVVRSSAANPSSQAIAVSLLQGSLKKLKEEAILQTQSCRAFEEDKRNRGIPDSIAAVRWVLHITSSEEDDVFSVVEALVQAIDGDPRDARIHRFCKALMTEFGGQGRNKGEKESSHQQPVTIDEIDDISPLPNSHGEPTRRQILYKTSDESSTKGESNEKQQDVNVLLREITSESLKQTGPRKCTTETSKASGTSCMQLDDSEVPSPRLTFMYTLDAVSEFTTTSPVPKVVALLIGLTSFLAILAVYITDLWQDQWQVSVALVLVLIGYIGIVLAVMAAALLIHSSCTCIKLESRSAYNSTVWMDGLVVSVKNTDSMDTTGSELMSSQFGAQNFEVVWMKDLTGRRKMLASGVAVALVISFICHYLGLRSSDWWVAVGELLICILAAAARSATKDRQEKLNLVENVKIDKRCTSTGIITTQKSHQISKPLQNHRTIDARAYSMVSLGHAPANGESIAWHMAKLCYQNNHITSQILALTGMRIHIIPDIEHPNHCAILASYTGGLLVTEGLASPTARLCLAFRTQISDLALPTALLARACMRQAEWRVSPFPPHADDAESGQQANGLPLGNVYVFSITSVMDWWTLSEDRNDLGDLQRNLKWCFVLINAAFFVELLRITQEEGLVQVRDGVEKVFGKVSESDSKVAEDVVRYFGRQEG